VLSPFSWWPNFGDSLELGYRPPLRGAPMTQILSQRTRWLRSGLARLETEEQRGPAVKAVFALQCSIPDLEHGSGDWIDGGGVALKRLRAGPRE
jgi:hypothetical protein